MRAPRGDVVDVLHGTKVADPYRWLEDDGDATRAWVRAQNERTEAWLRQDEGLRGRIRERLAQLKDHPRRGAPWRRGDRWFQMRNSGVQEQDVLWTMAGPDDEGRVLVDPADLGDGVALTGLAVSGDGALLAWAISEAGTDWQTWRVRDVATGGDLPDELRWSKYAEGAWLPDGSGFLYGRYPAPPPGAELTEVARDHRLCLHHLGTPQSQDRVVYARPDQPEWIFSSHVTDDGRWLVVRVDQGNERRHRLFLADLEAGDPEPFPLVGEFDAAYDLVGNVGETFFVHTDRDAPRGRIVAFSVDEPERWRDVVGEGDTAIEQADLLGGRLIVRRLHDARHRLWRHALDGTDEGEIALPGAGTVPQVTGRLEDPQVHFTFEAFTAPVAVCRHDLRTRETRYATEPGLAVDESAFEVEQVFVESAGARVPMFLVRRADLPRPGESDARPVPTLLYGYGGFGIPLTPQFRVWWLVWLELGGQLAVAGLRGGGEYGEDWHEAGRGPRKQQVFDDFVACAEALVDSGWTTPARLAINGGSNGGLLVGACMTQRPELFGACVPEVGVLDMLRFHLFTIGWAWTDEYGSADDPGQFKVLQAYSPLHNVWPRTAYPPTLLTTGDHDDRVVPAHTYKFAAALQAAQAGDAPILVRIDTDAGHGAGKPTRRAIEERADVLTFLVRALRQESS